MNKVLKDPNKAAHEIIEVLSGGDAIRNDGVRLTAANKNPWYVLATIYGEQDDYIELLDGNRKWRYNKDIADQNRVAWNLWASVCQNKKDASNPVDRKNLEEIKERYIKRMNDAGEDAIDLPTWSKGIDFSRIYFDNALCMEQYSFLSPVSFKSSVFLSFVSFDRTQFLMSADFSSIVFNRYAGFDHASFCGHADFGNSHFIGYADFSFCKFLVYSDFSYVVFRGRADFGSVKFDGVISYRHTHFAGFAHFSRSDFKAVTRFNDAVFSFAMPEFHAANMYEETTFSTPRNYRENWPSLASRTLVSGTEEKGDEMSISEQKRAYSRLRLFMSGSLQIDEEQFFHRMEMRCKAVLAKWYHKPLYWLFATFSDYGNSVWRPIAWGALSVVAAALFMLWWQGVFAFTPQNDAGFDWAFGLLGDGDVWAKPREAFGWSISNALPFIGTGSLYYGDEFAKELAWPLRVVGGVQTLFGFVLLFLFGLGLRNRFRLR